MASPLGGAQPPSSENSLPRCQIDETPQEQRQKTPLRDRGGYDCEFVERPKELETDCPICLQVLRDPFQVTCCGNSFCQSCIKRVQVGKKSCPTCNEADFNLFPDKRLQRSLYAFQVRCVHQKSGCKWIGELGELDGHLNLNPELGRQLIGCEFADVACTHCCEYLQRRHVYAHENESCPQRPFSCDYCKDYGSVYEDVVNNHWPVCKCYPVPCPNECGVSPERQNVETHVNTVCPLTVVNCDFHYAGCEVQLVRKDMPTHLAESLLPHLSLLALHNQQLTQLTIQQKESLEELRKENEVLRKNVNKNVSQEIAELRKQLNENLKEIQLKIQELEREQATVIAELQKSSNTSKREIEALKLKVSKDVSQEVAKLKRQQKNSLEESQRTIQELEQKTLTGQHEIEVLKMKVNQDVAQGVAELRRQLKETQNESQHTIQELEREKQAQTTVNAELQRCSVANKHEIGALKQKVYDSVDQEMAELRRQQDKDKASLVTLQQQIRALPPLKLTMINYREMKKINGEWCSPPFYTHPRGYKMCLKVYANGWNVGKGTHVSVFARLMRGEFDDRLKWPFQGIVVLQLCNQLEDKYHCGVTIDFSKTAGPKSISRVTSGEQAESGFGIQTFVANSDLPFNLANNCQFLKDDCLHFQIVAVESLSEPGVLPTERTMTNFEQHKISHWFSLPFYTHPQGYKMCLSVVPNGSGIGRNTHVSVFAYLMRGEFDRHLKWPFQGHVTVAMLNQLEDNHHTTRMIRFTETTDNSAIDRVTEREIAPNGWGYHTFIAHTDLGYNPAKNCRYLQYDCLRFQIIKVELK